MATIRTFQDLVAWQRAMDLAVSVYKTTAQLPRSERFGLISQLRRAVVSISANIAEGYGRSRTGDYKHFLLIALGSAREVQSLLFLCLKLGLIDGAEEALDQVDQTCALIYKLEQSISR